MAASQRASCSDEVVQSLRLALRDIGRLGGSGRASSAEPGLSEVTASQQVLQIAALHKGFTALSNAFMESLATQRAESDELREEVASAKKIAEEKAELALELSEGLEVLKGENEALRAQNAELAKHVVELEERIEGLERSWDRLREHCIRDAARAAEAQGSAAEARAAEVAAEIAAREGRAASKRYVAERLPSVVHVEVKARLKGLGPAECADAVRSARVASQGVEDLAARLARLEAAGDGTASRVSELEERSARAEAELGSVEARAAELEQHALASATSTADAITSIAADVSGVGDRVAALEAAARNALAEGSARRTGAGGAANGDALGRTWNDSAGRSPARFGAGAREERHSAPPLGDASLSARFASVRAAGDPDDRLTSARARGHDQDDRFGSRPAGLASARSSARPLADGGSLLGGGGLFAGDLLRSREPDQAGSRAASLEPRTAPPSWRDRISSGLPDLDKPTTARSAASLRDAIPASWPRPDAFDGPTSRP